MQWNELVQHVTHGSYVDALKRDVALEALYQNWQKKQKTTLRQRVFDILTCDERDAVLQTSLTTPHGWVHIMASDLELYEFKSKSKIEDDSKSIQSWLQNHGVLSSQPWFPRVSFDEQFNQLISIQDQFHSQIAFPAKSQILANTYVLRRNDFGYNVAKPIIHAILWYHGPDSDPLQEHKIIDILKMMTSNCECEFNWCWFVNPIEKRSVPEIPHAHILLLRK